MLIFHEYLSYFREITSQNQINKILLWSSLGKNMYKNIYNSLYFKKSLGLKIQEMTFSVKCYSKHIKLHFNFDCLQIFSKYCF